MALLRCSLPCSSSHKCIIIIQKHSPLKRALSSRVMMIAQPAENNSITVQISTTPVLEIKPSSKNKVFEDQSKGIVCYRDAESGEITCEGYDEGPRLHRHQHHSTCYIHNNPGDAEMIDVLQRLWKLQVVDHQDGPVAANSNPLTLDSTTYLAN